MFYIFYDTVWFVVVYTLVYKAMDLFFRDYSESLKILFDIDANTFGYNQEIDIRRKHTNLFWSSVPVSFGILTINPILHNLVYMTVCMMISVMDLNRVLYYSILFKLAIRVNLLDYRFSQLLSAHDFLILCQLVLIVANYTNTSSALPTLFQIIDESTEVLSVVLVKMLETHGSLFKRDTVINSRLLSIKAFWVVKERKLMWLKFGLMVLIFCYTMVYVASLTAIQDLAFCYYSVARLVQIYTGELKNKSA